MPTVSKKKLDQSLCPCSRTLITNLSQPVFPLFMISLPTLNYPQVSCIFLLSHVKHSPLHNLHSYYLTLLQMPSLVLCLSMVTSRWLVNRKVKLLAFSLLVFSPLTCLLLPFVCEHRVWHQKKPKKPSHHQQSCARSSQHRLIYANVHILPFLQYMIYLICSLGFKTSGARTTISAYIIVSTIKI